MAFGGIKILKKPYFRRKNSLTKEGKNFYKAQYRQSVFCNFKLLKILQMIKIPIQNESPFELPSYATTAAAGLDLKAVLEAAITLQPLERRIISTGLKIALPVGYEAQVRPRSGLAAKHGISVLNAPGTIDADYRGEIGVILVNLSNEAFTLQPGERIAQLVIAKHEQIEWEPTESLTNTARGAGGFGSTGKK